MRLRRVIFAVAVAFLLTGSAPAATDISKELADLKTLISQLPLSSNEKDALIDYVNAIEASQPPEGIFYNHVVSRTVEVIAEQLATMMIEELTGYPALKAENAEDEEDPLDVILDKIDEISAKLFFGMPQLYALPYDVYMMMSYCSVTILSRGFGHLAFDPGGILYVRFADRVELEARAMEAGGNFTWEIDFSNEDRYTKDNRAYFRMVDEETAVVKVTYDSPMGGKCQDILRVVLQDGFLHEDFLFPQTLGANNDK
jgi:hypothetical protein